MAEFIEWDEKLSVGINEIDEQHKKLVGIITISKMYKSRERKRSYCACLRAL